MSIHLLKLLLSELKTVRVVCKRNIKGKECGGIVEVPLERLGSLERCPLCREAFETTENRFEAFARAAQQLLEKTELSVEFVLTEKA